MPVLTKEIELDDGSKIEVKQASGMKKLKIEARQAKVFRQFRHFGNPNDWSIEQHEEFADALDKAEAGLEAQASEWLTDCIITEGVDIDALTSPELMKVLNFVRGDEIESPEGSAPLE